MKQKTIINSDTPSKKQNKGSVFERGICNNAIKVTIKMNPISATNLCALNSFLHGMLIIYYTDSEFRQYMEINADSISYFDLISRIVSVSNINQRNHIWISHLILKFVMEFSQMRYGECDMVLNVCDTTRILLDESIDKSERRLSSFTLVCSCLNCAIKNEFAWSIISVKVRSNKFEDLPSVIINAVSKSYLKCVCDNDYSRKLTFTNLIFLNMAAVDAGLFINLTLAEVPWGIMI